MTPLEKTLATAIPLLALAACSSGGPASGALLDSPAIAALSPTATPAPPATTVDDWTIEVLNRNGPFELYSVYIGTDQFYYLGTVDRDATATDHRYGLPYHDAGFALVLKHTEDDQVVQTLGVEAGQGAVLQLTVDQRFSPDISGGQPAN